MSETSEGRIAPSGKSHARLAFWILVAGFGVAQAYYGWIAASQHWSLHTYPHDVGMIDYALHWTLHGKFMYSPLIGQSHFGVHFTPTLLLALPFYALHDSPLTLLLFQSVLLAGAAVPLFLLARKTTGSVMAAGLLGGLYLVNYYVGSIHQASHYEALLPVFALAAMYCALAGHRRSYWVFLILALGVKTDVGLYLFPFGLYMLLARRDRILGYGTMALSLVWFAMAVLVTRVFAPEGRTPEYLRFWSAYGDSLPAIALYLATHPWLVLKSLWSLPLLMLLATCGFLCLADWRSALLIAPPVVLLLLSPAPDFQNLAYYRSATIIPFLFFAATLGLGRIARHPRVPRRALMGVLAALVIANGAVWLARPTLSNGFRMLPFEVTEHTRAAARLARRVPPEGRLAVQWDLYCQAPHRADIVLLDEYANADYVFLDVQGFLGLTPRSTARQALQEARANMDILDEEDGLLLAGRRRQAPR